VTDICVFAFFFPSLFLVLAFRVFVFYIILKKRVVDRGCAVSLAGECTVPGSVFSLSMFSGAFFFWFLFPWFLCLHNICRKVFGLSEDVVSEIETFIGLSVIACFLQLLV